MPRLSALYVYPVKSCRGIALDEAILDGRGITHDREFLVVDAQDRFMTQRATPALARIATAITADALVLSADGAGALHVPWRAPVGAPARPTRPVVIWRDTVTADDIGDEAAAWLSGVIGQPCRLVATGASSARTRTTARDMDGQTRPLPRPVPLAFPDGYPLLVLSEESVRDLNARIGSGPLLTMERFRPNLVVTGCDAPYAEDHWKTYRVGDVRLESAGPCARCVITTIEPRTLERGREPLRTLAGYRRWPEGDVMFGQNVIHASPGGRLRVGDEVELET